MSESLLQITQIYMKILVKYIEIYLVKEYIDIVFEKLL